MATNDTATFTLSAGPELVTVIERLELGTPETGPGPNSSAPPRPTDAPTVSTEQVVAVDAARRHIDAVWRHDEDFAGSLLLRSRDHNRLTVYSQWRRRPNPVPAEPPPAWSIAAPARAAEPNTRVLDARTYHVEFTDGAHPPTTLSTGSTPFVHFGIFSVAAGQQDALLDLAREYAPASLVTPGIVAVNFHRSLDGRQVVNLGPWTSFDAFTKLFDISGFKDESVYWEGVAQFQPDYFDLVDVTPM